MKERFESFIAEKRPEVITDAQKAREAMLGFWHREVDLETLEKEIELQEKMHRADLLRTGGEMTLLMEMYQKEKKELPADPSRFLFASQNETKLRMAGEASVGTGMTLQETMFQMTQEEEGFEHKILKQLINERRSKYAPKTIREYTPAYFAIDVAEAKASKMHADHRGLAVMGADIVVLCGNRILEKPKSEKEALEMLRLISGKKIKIAFGVVLVTPTSLGKTISLNEGGYFYIKLRNFSERDAREYLEKLGKAGLGVVGGIDYASPLSQRLLSDKPVEAMPLRLLSLRRQTGESEKPIKIAPAVLTQLKDYFMGVPKELIQEMLGRAKLLQEKPK